ncbi:iron ABC transporter ATP-binding protein [Hutsoniella sourekii]
MVKINRVIKEYKGQVAVGPINLDIPKPGITSIIGPNGAGKSTLLMMIGRLLEMDGGSITVGGIDVSTGKSSELAQHLAILRQENHFSTRLTVRQLVSFGRYPYSKGRLNQEDYAIINRYLSFLHLEDLADRYLDELSGGQRQRAYVGMVLAQETDYILLDEPLNNLDIEHSVQMMKHLRRIADEFQRSIILVMHDLNFTARYSDYICAMCQGQITHWGSVDQVMTTEVMSEIFSCEIEIVQALCGPVVIY